MPSAEEGNVNHERQPSIENVMPMPMPASMGRGRGRGRGGGLSARTKTTTQRVGREQSATLSLELPGGQELLKLRIGCPSS